MKNHSILFKIFLSVLSFIGYHYINVQLKTYSASLQAHAALKQFSGNAHDYAMAHVEMSFWQEYHVPFIALLVVLGFIWYKQIKEYIGFPALSIFLCTSLLVPNTSYAYYDKQDYTESYPVLPNQTVFLVSNDGDKNNQARLHSEEYLNSPEVKVPQELVQIPHTKLSGSGAFRDYYIPSSRLIIVDRTTYSRTWVGDPKKGSSAADESFPCQTKEGLNATAGISIATRIDPEKAAKYLYNFGVKSQEAIDYSNPTELFQSVYHAKSLQEVMDNVVKGEIHTLVCKQISARGLDTANAEMGIMMDNVTKEVSKYLDSVGITLINVGFADTLQFDPEVQKAINDLYISNTLQSSLPVLQSLADIKVKEGVAYGIAEHGIPSTLVTSKDDPLLAPLYKSLAPVVQK
jgi:hypothetical protein